MSKVATIEIEGKSFELPLVVGSEKEIGIDIKQLRGQTGAITFDPGYKNTGACESAITFLDGEEGVLRYRGYTIEELAEKADFLEVTYLLIFGELPTKEQLQKFNSDILEHSKVDEGMKAIVNSLPTSTHPMGALASITSALTAFHPETVNLETEEEMYDAIVKLLAKFPAMAAWTLRRRNGEALTDRDQSLGYVESLLKLMFEKEGQEYKLDATVVDALDKLLILHADHEQNCSASTVRIVGSSQASLFSSISAGISALWGPLHGGANQAVIEMLEQIKADGGDTSKYIDKAKDRSDAFRLMGFGHRVYKNFDPRAKIIKKSADEVLDQLGVEDPVLEIAKGLEKAALEDQYFVDRKLYPNVDFYSGIIYKAMGIPTEMFTVMFAVGRLPGWIAQWREMRQNKEPIGRPRQIYVGENERKFKDIDAR